MWRLEVELGIVTAGRERTVVDRPFAFGSHLLNVESAGTGIGAQRLQLLLGFRIMVVVRSLKRPFVTDSLVFAEIGNLPHPDVSVQQVRPLHCNRKADYGSPAVPKEEDLALVVFMAKQLDQSDRVIAVPLRR